MEPWYKVAAELRGLAWTSDSAEKPSVHPSSLRTDGGVIEIIGDFFRSCLACRSILRVFRQNRLLNTAKILHFKPMLPIPLLGAGVERHVARRGVGVFAQLADAGVRVLPKHLFSTLIDGVADFVGVVVRQRRAGVERPAAVVDAGVL